MNFTQPLTITKNHWGEYVAEEIHHLEGDRYLTIATTKHGRSLSTMASVSIHKMDGTTKSTTHALFVDFNTRLAQGPVARVTQTAIAAFHRAAITDLPALLTTAKAFYARKP